METDKIITKYKDYNFLFEIFAYRTLTRFECKNIVDEYMQLQDHEIPQEGKTIKINTEIH
jgi:hypothetical protein